MNAFRCTPDRSLDKVYLRTCIIYRALARGWVDKAGALELARRKIRGVYSSPTRLDATIEIWLAGSLR